MSSDPAGDPGRSDGSSADRTRLAWRRTVLATSAVALLTVRLAVVDGLTPARTAAVAASAAAWIVQLGIAQRRIRAMARPHPGGIGRTLPTIAGLTVAYAAVGIALTLSR